MVLVCLRLLDVRGLCALFGWLFRALIGNGGLFSEAGPSSSDYETIVVVDAPSCCTEC
jgi:hypothetical protein